jgi:hypothetical protein
MGRITFHSGVSQDRQQTVLEIHDDGKPLAHIVVDAAMLEGIIRGLGACRSAMAEAVPGELDPGARLEVTPLPAWTIPNRHSGPNGTLLLGLRHPGLGWLGFLLEEERARQIGSALCSIRPNGEQT